MIRQENPMNQDKVSAKASFGPVIVCNKQLENDNITLIEVPLKGIADLNALVSRLVMPICGTQQVRLSCW